MYPAITVRPFMIYGYFHYGHEAGLNGGMNTAIADLGGVGPVYATNNILVMQLLCGLILLEYYK